MNGAKARTYSRLLSNRLFSLRSLRTSCSSFCPSSCLFAGGAARKVPGAASEEGERGQNRAAQLEPSRQNENEPPSDFEAGWRLFEPRPVGADLDSPNERRFRPRTR